MSPIATIVIPTHDHSPLLEFSVESARSQTLQDIEIFVVGDGVPEETRALMNRYTTSDTRIRFFDNPKGERLGETHRHAALTQARGEIVCYLSDDDLWLPGHIEQMRALLSMCDFAHAAPLFVSTDGVVSVYCGDLSDRASLNRLREGTNFIPLSTAGHTRDLYRRLPFGWRPAPPDVYSDLHMWQQILSVDSVRARSGAGCTVINFPSPLRREQTSELRVAELHRWQSFIRSPGAQEELAVRALEYMTAQRAAELSAAELRLTLERHLLAAHRRIDALEQEVVRGSDYRAELEQTCARSAARIQELERLIARVESGVTFRLRRRALAVPLLGALLRAGIGRQTRA